MVAVPIIPFSMRDWQVTIRVAFFFLMFRRGVSENVTCAVLPTGVSLGKKMRHRLTTTFSFSSLLCWYCLGWQETCSLHIEHNIGHWLIEWINNGSDSIDSGSSLEKNNSTWKKQYQEQWQLVLWWTKNVCVQILWMPNRTCGKGVNSPFPLTLMLTSGWSRRQESFLIHDCCVGLT